MKELFTAYLLAAALVAFLARRLRRPENMTSSSIHSTMALISVGAISPRQLMFFAILLAALVAIIANREVRKAFWEPAQAGGGAAAVEAIRPWRLLLVYGLGVVVIGGSLFSWVTDAEHWPFSSYPMFSWLYPATDYKFTTLRLYGVTQGEPSTEFPLDRNVYLEPFDNSRLPNALDIAIRENKIAPVLKDCLERYEALRVSGIHDGPPIRGLRLYRVRWNLNAEASNAENPDSRELLGEFSESTTKGPLH